MDQAYLESFVAGLCSGSDKVDHLDPPLRMMEVERIQKRFGFKFPTDLRALLEYALPVGKQWPNWREESSQELQKRLARPWDGIRFDVIHNGFWPPVWGSKPPDEPGRLYLVNQMAESAPPLIPIYSHCYIPAELPKSGYPVFSVDRSKIVYYGNDLVSFFQYEFGLPLPEWAAREPRRVRFWSDAVGW